MIRGIGCDVASLERFESHIDKEHFMGRLYTEAERASLEGLCFSRKLERAVGMFAAKEAVAKALGTGFRGFGFSDVEILHDELGAPYVCASERVPLPADAKIHLSISHDGGFAMAFAVIETD